MKKFTEDEKMIAKNIDEKYKWEDNEPTRISDIYDPYGTGMEETTQNETYHGKHAAL